MVKRFEIVKNGVCLVGRLYSLDMEQVRPAILLSHEFGLSMRSTARYARRLYRAGYHVFIYDFAGSGAGKSRGRSSVEMSVETEKEDLETVFAYVKRLPFVDGAHISLGGASFGGLVTALFAAEHKDWVEKLFLYYPAFCVPDDARRGCVLGKRIDLAAIPADFVCMGYVHLGPRYVKAAQVLDPWRDIAPYDKPVLICHGTKDAIVPLAYARKAAEVYPQAKLLERKGANHCFVLPRTVDWALEQTLHFLGADTRQ